jgi:hypothetical protein
MPTATEILAALQALLEAPGELVSLINTLKATPIEQRQKIVSDAQAAATSFQSTGVP